MKRVWVLGITFALLFSLSGTAYAATPTLTVTTPLETRAQAATVNIYCTYSSGSRTYSSTGTGVFVSERGAILTNAHVVQPFLINKAKSKSKCVARTGSPARSEYTLSLLYLSPNWVAENVGELSKSTPRGTGEGDFALLYVTGSTDTDPLPLTFPSVSLGTGFPFVTEGEEVTATGYPAEDLDYEGVQKKLKRDTESSTVLSIRSFMRPWQEALTMSPSDVGSPGSSGGPVTNATGDLIGIVAAVESGKDRDERDIRAITLNHINRSLIEEQGTTLSLLLSEDYAVRSALTITALTDELRTKVTKALLKRR